MEPVAVRGAAGSVCHCPVPGTPQQPLATDSDSHLFQARGGWYTCLWGRSIIWRTPPRSGVIAENVTTVTWNQALSSRRGFYLFPYEDATAAGRIKVVCTCFAAKWPYLMTWIPKALTYAAGFFPFTPRAHASRLLHFRCCGVSVMPTEKTFSVACCHAVIDISCNKIKCYGTVILLDAR